VNPVNNGTSKPELGVGMNDDSQPLSFPDWSEALAAQVGLDPDAKSRRKFAILGLHRFCKEKRRLVSVTLVKGYLAV
jgi:hypothetical protein